MSRTLHILVGCTRSYHHRQGVHHHQSVQAAQSTFLDRWAGNWTKKNQKLFHDLAVKEARGTLPPERLPELNELQLKRRRCHPRSAEELRVELETNQEINGLKDQLNLLAITGSRSTYKLRGEKTYTNITSQP